MTSLLRRCFVPFALAALVGCGHPAAHLPGDGGNPPPDGGTPPPDGGTPQGSRPVLRANIGIDLSQVSAFAVVTGTSSARPATRGGLSPMGGGDDGGVPPGPQLLALTLDGEVLQVTLVEDGNPQSGGVLAQPQVGAIYPTASWILFSTGGFSAWKLQDDGSYAAIGCSLIAARRADGALFCAPLAIGGGNVVDNRYARVQVNAAGDLAYAFAAVVDPEGPGPTNTDYRLYQITLGGADGPTAAVANGATMYSANWFLANATGDLVVNYAPMPLDPSATTTKVWPADGASPVTLQTTNAFAICGQPGAADEDTFYLAVGGGGGVPADGTIVAVTRSGADFVETPSTYTLADVNTYGGLYRLADGIYTFSKSAMALARVIANGAVIPDPPIVTISGVTQLLDLQGMAIAGGAGQAVFLGTTATGYEFVRHDGITQQDIPLDPNLELWSVTVGASGAIDFLGVRTDTQEKVRGSIPADSTEVSVTSAGVVDPNQVVVFTQIN